MKKLLIVGLVILVATISVVSTGVGRIEGKSNYVGGPYLPLVASDFDVNDDGVINEVEVKVAEDAYLDPSKYTPKLDVRYDGVIDAVDVAYIKRLAAEHLNLQEIRDNLITGEETTLTWNAEFSSQLKALSPDLEKISYFMWTNVGRFLWPGSKYDQQPTGWLHIDCHPYINHGWGTPDRYVCHMYATDTMVAAYKALGYGCIIYASVTRISDGVSHAANMFWVGGDWHDLYNWRIVDPEEPDQIYNAATLKNTGTDIFTTHYYDYKPESIDFPVRVELNCYGNPRVLRIFRLFVDFDAKTVNYSSWNPGVLEFMGYPETCIEKLPDDYIFDLFLGREKDKEMFSFNIPSGWSLISVPFITDASILDLPLILYWDGSVWQQETETLLQGKGYLVLSYTIKDITLTGTSTYSPFTEPCTGSWQLIGNPFAAPASLSCTSTIQLIFYFDGSMWQFADRNSLQPGVGYLIETDSVGTLTMTVNQYP